MLNKITQYFQNLRVKCIEAFESLEPSKHFERKPWKKPSLGSGEIGILRGDVFEKAAVNFSLVFGENFPMQDAQGAFTATGVSLITHMMNPHMPTAHFNVRFMQFKDRYWFGGGYDLTPMGFEKEEDTLFFHKVAKESLDGQGLGLYEKFYNEAKSYFYISHWKKERGVGGIFFDHYSTGDIEKDFQLVQTVGTSFLEALMPIYRKNLALPFSKEDKELQNRLRAHYVEFNLLYDRGTQFGFRSGGNPEAILCSMPPTATW